MTIHKQYYEYHELKNLMYAQLRFVNLMGVVLMCLGMAYMIYLTISLFVDHIIEPIAVIISEVLVYGSNMGGSYVEQYDGWTIVVFKITGFMTAIVFILIASYIIYYKSVVKVDAMLHLSKMSVYCLYSYLIIGLLHTTFVSLFTATEVICPAKIPKDECTKEKLEDDDGTKNTIRQVIAILFQLLFFAGQFACVF